MLKLKKPVPEEIINSLGENILDHHDETYDVEKWINESDYPQIVKDYVKEAEDYSVRIAFYINNNELTVTQYGFFAYLFDGRQDKQFDDQTNYIHKYIEDKLREYIVS